MSLHVQPDTRIAPFTVNAQERLGRVDESRATTLPRTLPFAALLERRKALWRPFLADVFPSLSPLLGRSSQKPGQHASGKEVSRAHSISDLYFGHLILHLPLLPFLCSLRYHFYMSDNEFRAQIAALVGQGLDFPEVADRLGCSSHFVSNIIRLHYPHLRQDPGRDDDIRGEYRAGKTQRELAKKYGLSRSQVWSICKGSRDL